MKTSFPFWAALVAAAWVSGCQCAEVGQCGDGKVNPGETCDDANTADGDGCSASCQAEDGYLCVGASCTATCGDAKVVGSEACDDGNRVAGDGCSDACAIETGWNCVGTPSVCQPGCGDRKVLGNEGCDDGNTTAGDGCSAACLLEPGWSCQGMPSVCTAVCGDNLLTGAEACDDGNTDLDDGCSATCTVETGWSCSGTPSTCAPVCGDGLRRSREQCDDANTNDGDGCSASCQTETGFTCTGAPASCSPICADGVVVRGEGCDDHNLVTGDGCNATCGVELGWACTGSPSTCAPVCGDGLVTGAEACDDGNTMTGDGCSDLCVKEAGWTCAGAPSACVTTCGDGVVAGTEVCDDQNTTAGDGCSDTCTRETGWTCTGMPSACATTCGDTVRAGLEQCDDGNLVALDGCNAQCRIDVFDEVEPNDARSQANGPYPAPFVFRGAVQPAWDVDQVQLTLTSAADLWLETTDETGTGCLNLDTVVTLTDSNGGVVATDDDSGQGQCSKLDSRSNARLTHLAAGTYTVSVQSYAGFRAVPAYRLFVRLNALCGDGARTGSEACDGTAACDATCVRVPTCGDRFVDGTEQCDDGNTTPGDGCNATCVLELKIETEPNDTTATANGPLPRQALMGGTNSAASDVDVFSLTLPTVSDLKLETFDASAVTCVGLDTVLTLLAPDGTTVLARRAQGGVGNCAAIDSSRLLDAAAQHLAAGTYFVKVEGVTNVPYRLLVSTLAACGNGVREGAEECDGTAGCTATCDRVPVCGDGFVDAPETCDDGNTALNDGCNATCVFEGGLELEPNDTAANATDAGVPFAQFRGAITDGGTDVDLYRVTLSATTDLVVETFDGTGAGHCGGRMDTVVTLLAADGTTVLASEDDRGLNACSRIDPRWDTGARQLAAGTYFVKVEDFNHDTAIPAYTVQISAASTCGNAVLESFETCDGTANCSATCQSVAVCGDSFNDTPEACDDGNTASGDGCSATCQVEGAEIEPNDTTATANPFRALVTGAIGVVGDRDVYQLQVTTAQVVRLETFDVGGRACSIATSLRLLDGAGAELYRDDNSGIATCSALVVALVPGTYFVSVEQRGNTATLPGYQLQARTLGAALNEVEPNELRSTATSVGVVSGVDVLVFGSHQTALDSDFFSFTVPDGRSVRIELLEGSTAETCESNGIDSFLTLYGPGGQSLGWDDDSGRGACSRIDGTGAGAPQGWASRLPGGTYTVQVEAAPFVQMGNNPAAQFDYRLVFTIR